MVFTEALDNVFVSLRNYADPHHYCRGDRRRENQENNKTWHIPSFFALI
jgi:hypothetical protein